MAERQHDNVAAHSRNRRRALQATDLILQQAALLDPDAFPRSTGAAAIPDLCGAVHERRGPGGETSSCSIRPGICT